jgi:chromosome segregation ATPase
MSEKADAGGETISCIILSDNNEIIKLKHKIEVLIEKVEELTCQNDNFRDNNDMLTEKVNELNQKFEQLKRDNGNFRHNNDTLTEKVNELNQKFEQLKRDNHNFRHNNEMLSEKVEKLTHSNDNFRRDIEVLKANQQEIKELSFTIDLKKKMIAFFIEKNKDEKTFIDLEFVKVNRSGIETIKMDNFYSFINSWNKVKNEKQKFENKKKMEEINSKFQLFTNGNILLFDDNFKRLSSLRNSNECCHSEIINSIDFQNLEPIETEINNFITYKEHASKILNVFVNILIY